MSTGYVLPVPRFRAFDQVTGAPLAGGKLYAYQAGTVTPQAVYTDQALTTPAANPFTLDSNGEATLYAPDGTFYKFNLTDALGVQQSGWPVDNWSTPSATPPPAVSNVPAGGLMAYGGTSAPTGYLLCDGSLVSRAAFAALFAAIGTGFGAGDGSTTFGLPDLRQRFPLGKATAGTGNVLGSTGGTIDHVHTGPAHTHLVACPIDGWGSVFSTPGTTGRLQTGNAGGSGADASEYMATTANTVSTGAATAANTGLANPPFQAVNWIIKT